MAISCIAGTILPSTSNCVVIVTSLISCSCSACFSFHACRAVYACPMHVSICHVIVQATRPQIKLCRVPCLCMSLYVPNSPLYLSHHDSEYGVRVCASGWRGYVGTWVRACMWRACAHVCVPIKSSTRNERLTTFPRVDLLLRRPRPWGLPPVTIPRLKVIHHNAFGCLQTQWPVDINTRRAMCVQEKVVCACQGPCQGPCVDIMHN